MAYSNQGKSLRLVQQFGPGLEKRIREFLGWRSGRIVFADILGEQYDVQVDSCFPNTQSPQAFVSTTYCNPDKPGHSNENKFQLKVGELMLLKARYPDIRSILVLGGKQDTWMPYVLAAFRYFFDEVVCLWEEASEAYLAEIGKNPSIVSLKHVDVWNQIANEWSDINFSGDPPIDSRLRLDAWEWIHEVGVEGDEPSEISNSIIRRCMGAAYERFKGSKGKSGKEWSNYVNASWDEIWQSRSFFNPGEAVIQMTLEEAKVAFLGGLAVDVEVPSMLHTLGGSVYERTKTAEDFILYSRKYDCPVYVQSKSSGGGRDRHGKNIQNRAKEQITRGLIYRTRVDENQQMILQDKDFVWIGLLDGNWGVTEKTPHKYIHMLQMAGYDYLLAADSLVDNLELVEPDDNPLRHIIDELDCLDDKEALKSAWSDWKEKRFALRDLLTIAPQIEVSEGEFEVDEEIED
ncbi:hypothetical protein IQ268_31595 [Oculatella sp. LEGE 06141]|uniref:hypothetical protein n=1 Tax=Oculatella sp. LEGE 06141 TaxID=1828648 RepID=UPI001882345B|nr:hypothetical protein [Oculatella sp. LEGE 06141]MBE9183081.1 hypothetical protein [Oculatella sp. LEGE 06141]